MDQAVQSFLQTTFSNMESSLRKASRRLAETVSSLDNPNRCHLRSTNRDDIGFAVDNFVYYALVEFMYKKFDL